MPTLTQAERLISPQYLAGCIDCDGCFSLVKMKPSPRGLIPRYEIRLALANTNMDILEAVRKEYGGRIKSGRRGNEIHKPLYIWETSGAAAEAITREIIPYLIIKKPRAALVFKFRATFSKNFAKVSEELVAVRESCYQEMKVLNKKGVVA